MNSNLPLDRQSDAALIAQYVAVREEEAFSELMRRHAPMVLATCVRVLRHRHDAEDASQAVFVILAARAGALRRVRSLGGWLYNVAVRVSYDVLRANRRRQQRLFTTSHDRPPTNTDDERELQEELDRALTALPGKYREALVLCDLEGHTREEAASKLKTSPGTVDTWVARGRKLLRERLVRRGVTLSAGALAAAQWASGAPPISSAMMHQTAQYAELYLAGKLATATLPAAARINHLAQGVLHHMFLTKLSTTVGIAVLVAALILSPAFNVTGIITPVRAAQFFIDDFEDGNLFDGNPVSWRTEGPPFDGSINAVVNGNLVLTPPETTPPLNYTESNLTADGLLFGDVSLRTRVRAQRAGPCYFGLAARNTYQLDNGLVGTNVIAYMENNGMLFIQGGENADGTPLASIATGLDFAAYDVNMQFDVIGRRAAVTVWREGAPKPTTPQLTVNNIPGFVASAGRVSMFNIQFLTPQPKIPIEVRFFAAVPEPSSVALGSLGIVTLASFTIRRRLLRAT